jgi:hypothetical protein
MQCPIDYPAVSCIAMAGAAIGRKIGLRPKRADDWTVVCNQWAKLVGRSGFMKSPALQAALAPLRKMQADAFRDYERAATDYELQTRMGKLRLEEAEKRARQCIKDGNELAAQSILTSAQDEQQAQPTTRRFIVIDSTVEALAETLEENPNGVLVYRDELSGWLRSLDKEGQQEARAFYLTAADGVGSFTTDRVGRGRGRPSEAVCG